MRGKASPLFNPYALTGSFCIDNGIMIAQAGLLAFRMGAATPLERTAVTQRQVIAVPPDPR